MDFVLLLILTALVAASMVGYARIFRRVYLAHEGKVMVDRFTRVDALLAGALVVGIIYVCFTGINSKRAIDPKTIDTGKLIAAVLNQWVIIIGTILALLLARGIQPSVVFGFNRLSTGHVILQAFGLLFLALPIVFATSYLVSMLFRIDPHQDSQEIVQIFQGAKDPGRKIPIILLAVLVAPLAEEFLFRGFLYGVFKRYFGAFPSLLFTGILFALLHLHLPSLLPLFVLACALTMAYELSGTLLVPMGMHAIFNATTLLMVSFGGQ
jgi:uncharacterized protein